MDDSFTHDVFLSHSSLDKPTVRDLANRLKVDGIRVWFDEWEIHPGDSIPAKIEQGLEHSRILLFCMSKNAFAADWPFLESHTFRFRDPLNKSRHFIPFPMTSLHSPPSRPPKTPPPKSSPATFEDQPMSKRFPIQFHTLDAQAFCRNFRLIADDCNDLEFPKSSHNKGMP